LHLRSPARFADAASRNGARHAMVNFPNWQIVETGENRNDRRNRHGFLGEMSR
jgi:hypothetical protein